VVSVCVCSGQSLHLRLILAVAYRGPSVSVHINSNSVRRSFINDTTKIKKVNVYKNCVINI